MTPRSIKRKAAKRSVPKREDLLMPLGEVYLSYGVEMGRLVNCPECGGRLKLQFVNIPLPADKQHVTLNADPLCVDFVDRDATEPWFWANCNACKKGWALGLDEGEVAQALFRGGPGAGS